MTFTHALSTNNYGPAKFIVATSSANGTHTTLASAMAAASSGDTIFMRDSVTENVTLTPGVNISAYGSDSSSNGTGKVKIIGKLTMTGAGSVTISGVQLQTNSDNFLVVSGSAASIVNLYNCYLNASNASGMTLSSSGGAVVNMFYCQGNIATAATKFFDISNAGSGFIMEYCRITNSGTTTASTASAGVFSIMYSEFDCSITTSGTTAGFTIVNSFLSAENTTVITHGSTNATGSTIRDSFIGSGSASAISVSAGAFLDCQNCIVSSSNTNTITGAGTLNFGAIHFSGSSSVINPTTQTGLYSNLGKYKATAQPSFSAYSDTSQSNATGDGTVVQVVFGTELFDIGSNFASSTFTAPVAGKYRFSVTVLTQDNLATHNPQIQLVASGVTYNYGNYGGSFAGNFPLSSSWLVSMAAGDTAIVNCNTSNGTKTVDIYGAAGDPRTIFAGELVG